MDEPLSGLDGPRKQELLRFIARLTRQVQIPVIYVSHDPEEISAIADHLVLMKEGRVIASDPLHGLLQRFDLTEELGGFDAASIIEGRVVEHDDVYQLTHLALDKCHQLIIPVYQRLSAAVCAYVSLHGILPWHSHRQRTPATVISSRLLLKKWKRCPPAHTRWSCC